MDSSHPNKAKPGPGPNRLKIADPDWEKAVKKALDKPRPPDGWPDEAKPKPRKKKGGKP